MMQASGTVRAIGPALSWLCAMGMTPALLMRPIVGLIPTTPLVEDGPTMDPSVSVPMVAVEKLAEAAAPDPELEPLGMRSSAYGFRQNPPRPPFQPRPLQPGVPRTNDFHPAHSLILALPRITAPAARNFSATKESFGGIDPCNAVEPAVVVILSAVPMLSFTRIGMPWSGPRGLFAFRSASSASATARALGLVSSTA